MEFIFLLFTLLFFWTILCLWNLLLIPWFVKYNIKMWTRMFGPTERITWLSERRVKVTRWIQFFYWFGGVFTTVILIAEVL